MEIDILSLIKSCHIFSSINEASLKKLTKKFDVIKLDKNKILFHQGDISDCLYLLVSGKLAFILTKRNKEKKIINQVQAGETVGEVGAISNEPRSVTAKTLEKSVLLKLSSEHFAELYNEFPGILLQTLNVLSKRSRKLMRLISEKEPQKKHIVIIPANAKTSLDKFNGKLNEHLQNIPEVALISELNFKFKEKDNVSGKLNKLISDYEKKNKKILYLPSSAKTALAKLCFEKIDMLYVVADADEEIHFDDSALAAITNKEWIYKAKPELILLHKKNNHLPKQTAKWLKLADFGLHHHIRVDRDQDIQRILRFMRGEAIGLVLGGGGLKSWAHVGIINALQEADIPIDAVCGTSAGALVAGYYALYEDQADFRKVFAGIFAAAKKATSWRSLTWPVISLYNGKAFTKEEMKIFGNARIEDLWLPFFSVACNISNNAAVMQRKGVMWKKIRGSTAVPGIFPPMVLKGKIFLDGGIANNLPVDLMKKWSPSIGTIIAVELTHNSKEKIRYNFPPILPFWKIALAKLGLAYKSYKFPNFLETFLTSLLAGSSIKQKENSLISDLLIAPDLSQYQLLKVSKKQEEEIIEIGYQTGLKAIKKWRSKQQKIKKLAKNAKLDD